MAERKTLTLNEIATAIRGLQSHAHETAQARRLIDSSSDIGGEIALAIADLTKALWYHRKSAGLRVVDTDNGSGKPRGFSVSLANALLRICTIAEHAGCDLGGATVLRATYNARRAKRA